MTADEAAVYIRHHVLLAKRADDMIEPYAHILRLCSAWDKHVWPAVNSELLKRWGGSTVNRIKGRAWDSLPASIQTTRYEELKKRVLQLIREYDGQ